MHSITLRFLASEASALPSARVPGGTVLRWMEEAGYACASAWAQGPCTTSAVGATEFTRQIRQGELVEVHARLTHTEGSRMTVAVEVRSGALNGSPLLDVLHCAAVYSAVDSDDAPREVDKWSPQTPGDVALAQRAQSMVSPARNPL